MLMHRPVAHCKTMPPTNLLHSRPDQARAISTTINNMRLPSEHWTTKYIVLCRSYRKTARQLTESIADSERYRRNGKKFKWNRFLSLLALRLETVARSMMIQNFSMFAFEFNGKAWNGERERPAQYIL